MTELKNLLYFIALSNALLIVIVVDRLLGITGYTYRSPELYRRGNFILTYWSLIHLLLYTISSMIAPNYWKELIILGIAFEILEYAVAKLCNNCIFPNLTDPLVNATGVVLGIFIRKILLKNY